MKSGKKLCGIAFRPIVLFMLFLLAGLHSQLSGQPYDYIPFVTGVPNLSMALFGDWGDVDGDGDYDVVYSAIIKETSMSQTFYIYKLLIAKNDGQNNFTPTTLISENSFDQGRIELVDFNNDNIPEIFAAGICSRWNLTYRIWEKSSNVKIWQYNGSGFGLIFNKTFTEEISSSGCADFDLDGAMDFHFGGRVYLNNGSGFDETYFHTSDFPSARWYSNRVKADIDSDGDPDNIEHFSIGMFNLNQANANSFSKPTIPVPTGVNINTSKNELNLFWDASTDTDSPNETLSYIVRLGTSSGGTQIVSPLANPLTGNILTPHVGNAGINKTSFTIKSPNLVRGTSYFWSVESMDEGGLCSGFSQEQSFTFSPFTMQSNNSFSRIGGTVIPADLNNNGSFEMVSAAVKVMGKNMPDFRVEIIDNTFQTITQYFPSPEYGYSASVSDFNNDNKLDIFLGEKTLINNGNFTYSEEITGIKTINVGGRPPILSADFDNDGDNDILIVGNKRSYLLNNTGSKSFVINDSITIIPFSNACASWGDYDNDNDLDIFVSGIDTSGARVCYIYKNNKYVFSKTDTEIAPVSDGTADWGDYDNDGYLDILISGTDNSGTFSTKVYKNTGHGFIEIEGPFISVGKNTYTSDYFPTFSNDASCKWGDFNNDGYLDIALYGMSKYNVPISVILINNKEQGFTILDANFSTNQAGSLIVGDLFDNDGALDIAFSGANGHPDNSRPLAYKNLAGKSEMPVSPKDLSFVQNGYDVLLSWDINSDINIKKGLSYNLRIGTSPNGTDILSPMADINTGKRLIVEKGRAGSISSWKISNLPTGTYYWSVQAIDHSFNGGDWAPESTFTISTINADFETDTVCFGLATSFTNKTVTNGVSITGWQWSFGDGNTSSLEHPQHTYTNPGYYTVQLISRTNSNADTIQHNVIVRPIAYPDFTVSLACLGTPTIFSNETDPSGLMINNWLWTFGDGQSSTLQNPGSHGYINAGEYNTVLWAFASNGCNSSIQKSVTVGSYPSAAVTTNAPTTFCAGSSVTLSVPNNSNYTYAWYLNGTGITGANTSQYIAIQSGNFSVSVTNATGNCKTNSSPVSVISHSLPTVPSISASGPVTFCQGDSVTLSVINTAGYTYEWRRDGGAIGINSNSYIANTAGTYILKVTNAAGCSVNAANTVTVVVNTLPSIPTVSITGNTTFCQGNSVILSVPSNSSYTYQWQNNGTNISGATSTSYTAKNSGVYSLTQRNSNSCTSKTENITVTSVSIPSSPTITASGPVQFCQGESVTLSVTPTTSYSYQWRLNDGSIGNNSNQITASNAGTYKLVVTNSNACSAISSNSVNVVVKSLPVAEAISRDGPVAFCQGNNVQLSVTNNPAYTYQWKKDNNNISGASTNAYSAFATGVYSLSIINSDGCINKTEEVNVTASTAPSAPMIKASGPVQFCLGESVTLSVTPTTGYSYKWKLNDGSVSGNTNQIIASNAGTYKLEVSNNGCSTPSINSIVVTVNSLPIIGAINLSGPAQFCSGGSLTLSATQTDNDYSYMWFNNLGPISGAVLNSFKATITDNYLLEVTNSLGCKAKTAPVNVLVGELPLKPIINKGNYIEGECLDEKPIKLSVTDVISGYSYQWYKNGVPVNNENFIEGFPEFGQYFVEADLNGCKSQSESIKVNSENAPPKPIIIAKGPTVWYLTSNIANAADYKWYYNGTVIPGTKGNIYVADQKLGKYNVSISNDKNCYTISDAITIPTGITGIDDTDPFEGVKIYPNPTSGTFTIEMNNNILGELIIDILSQNGRKMLNIKFEKSTGHFQSQIDLSGQSRGMYILNLSLDKFRAVRKVMVE